MDLWIRSQDKKRLVHAYGGEVVEASDGWKIREYATNDFVGKYKTEQRAIEVLGEIENKILESEEDFKGLLIYQMPADDEVK